MPINLDEARAARREAKKIAPEVILGGDLFTLPIEMPFAVTEDLGALKRAEKSKNNAAMSDAVTGIMKTLLGGQWDAFKKHQPSMEDLSALMEGLLGEYGLNEEAATAKAAADAGQPSV